MIANALLSAVALVAIFAPGRALAVLIVAGALLTFVGLRLAIWGRCALRRPVESCRDDHGAMITPRGTVRRGPHHRR